MPAGGGWHADLLLVANVGEEGEGNLSGMRHLCKQSPLGKKIGAFLVLDGASTDHITSRALGSRRFEVTFTGPGGHSWSDYGVGNPVHALSRAIAQFSDARLNGPPEIQPQCRLHRRRRQRQRDSALARAKVDIRSESNEKMDELVDSLTAAIEHALEVENQRATGGKVAVKIREIGARPAANLAEHSPILPISARWIVTWAFAHTWTARPPTPTFPCRWVSPRSLSAQAARAAARTPPQEWFKPEGRDLGLKRVLLTLCLLLRDPQFTATAQ